MGNTKTTATYALAGGLLAMAAALVYFSIVLTRVLFALPDLLEEIHVTAEKVDPIVDEVHQIQVQIPLILEEVGLIREQIPPILEQIPPILTEIEQIRLAIQPILGETEQIRLAIPPILEESAAYREQIPLILERVDAIEGQIPSILVEVEALREETIPSVIVQVEALRKEIPVQLAKLENIAQEIETAGKKASEGAVTGVFTGIIKAPMNIVTGISGARVPDEELSEEDQTIIYKTVETLITDGKMGDSQDWENPKTGIKGTVTIVEVYTEKDRSCMTLDIEAFKRRKKITDLLGNVCQNDEDTWEFTGWKE